MSTLLIFTTTALVAGIALRRPAWRITITITRTDSTGGNE